MKGGNNHTTLANGRSARPSTGPPSSNSRLDSHGGSRRKGSSSINDDINGIDNHNNEVVMPLQAPAAIPKSTLQRLGLLIDVGNNPVPRSSSPGLSSSSSSPGHGGGAGQSQSKMATTSTVTLEGLYALQEDLQRTKDAAEARQRDISFRRQRIVASSSSSFNTSRLPSSRSKLSPTATSNGTVKASKLHQPTPLNASNLGTNNAINTTSRGVKRSRVQDSISADSSLSPQSATSNSSFDINATSHAHSHSNSQSQNNAPRASSSRHTSPSVSVRDGTGSVTGNANSSSSKLSRSASSKDGAASISNKEKEATLPVSAIVPATVVTAPPKESKPPLIPGMGAPVPALPGFTKKKKQEKQASPAINTIRQYSPAHEPTPPPTASTSTLPPAHPSLPARPGHLPPKPVTSYTNSSSSASTPIHSLHRRETSATGSASSRSDVHKDRDRDRRERSISKGKEPERGTSVVPEDHHQHLDKRSGTQLRTATTLNGNTSSSDESRLASARSSRPPEPSPRPPEDEPPPPPPPPPLEESSPAPPPPPPVIPPSMKQEDVDDNDLVEAKTARTTIAVPPVIAIEDPTPSPNEAAISDGVAGTVSKTIVSTNEHEQAVTPTTAEFPTRHQQSAASSDNLSSQNQSLSQQGRGRKTLPPSTTGSPAPSGQSQNGPQPPSAISATAAVAASAAPSRPNTPLGRKKLPASVTAAASRHASPAVSAGTTYKGSVPDPISSPGHPTGARVGAELGQPAASKEGGKYPAIDAETLAAKQKRKEEKRKRKLAALLTGSDTGSVTSSPKASHHHGMNGLAPGGLHHGSPVIRINGVSPLSRNDSLPPSKMRRVDSATSIDSSDKSGLKLKLNGITLNRTQSASPAEPAHPPVKKGPSIPGVADDFTLPSRSLVPAPPAIQLPAPTPSKQSEINEDFDNAKPSSQVPYTTFANWVNDFFRSFGEDDLAFLAPKPEDLGVYEIPPLGPHYPDTWAAMDAELAGEQPDPPPPSTALVPPPLRRFKSSNLSTNALPTENMYLGPLGERLISAFKNTKDIRGMMEDLFAEQEQTTLDQRNAESSAMDTQVTSGDGVQAREASFNLQTSPQLAAPAMFNDPKLLAATPSIKEMDALDFESRLTRELSFLGLIPLPARAAPPVPTKPSKKNSVPDSNAATLDLSSSVDWSSRADDEISSALRACQRELRKQTTLNDKRKERLSQIVRQRIAYQEFEHLRDGLEAVIEGAWAKRQRAAQRKAQKDRKEKDKKGEREKDRDKIEAASLAQSIAALNTPQPLSASLVAALTKRRNLVDSVQPLFPPNAYILPEESIYQGMEVAPTKLAEGNFYK